MKESMAAEDVAASLISRPRNIAVSAHARTASRMLEERAIKYFAISVADGLCLNTEVASCPIKWRKQGPVRGFVHQADTTTISPRNRLEHCEKTDLYPKPQDQIQAHQCNDNDDRRQ